MLPEVGPKHVVGVASYTHFAKGSIELRLHLDNIILCKYRKVCSKVVTLFTGISPYPMYVRAKTILYATVHWSEDNCAQIVAL